MLQTELLISRVTNQTAPSPRRAWHHGNGGIGRGRRLLLRAVGGVLVEGDGAVEHLLQFAGLVDGRQIGVGRLQHLLIVGPHRPDQFLAGHQ